MRIKAVLFDLDGTLVDSNDRHVTVWQEVFRAEGIAADRAALHAQIGKGADGFVPAILPDADEATIKRLGEAHGDRFKRHHLAHVRPFPGAFDLLARVRNSGRRIAFASSASAAELDHYLDLLDARELVAATTTADDVAATKPAPDIFTTALNKLTGIAPDEAIVVGDTPWDIAAARRGGIGGVAVRSGGFSDATLVDALEIYDDVASLHAGFDGSPLNR